MNSRTSNSERSQLEDEIVRLQKEIKKFRELGEAVRTARTMDMSVYEEDNSVSWISMDRDDYDKIMEKLSEIDLWKPWNSEIKRRISNS